MDEKRLNQIMESAEAIIDSFKEVTDELPTEEETYYGQDLFNILRPDGKPSSREERMKFKRSFEEIMPKSDNDGNLKVEKGEWTE